MPVENFAEIWYHDHIVSLFIKESKNEQEKQNHSLRHRAVLPAVD